jgi:hypothetical protein
MFFFTTCTPKIEKVQILSRVTFASIKAKVKKNTKQNVFFSRFFCSVFLLFALMSGVHELSGQSLWFIHLKMKHWQNKRNIFQFWTRKNCLEKFLWRGVFDAFFSYNSNWWIYYLYIEKHLTIIFVFSSLWKRLLF